MINFTTNQRRASRWDGNDWYEEVLAASGVETSTGSFSTVSGAEAQTLFEAIDNELTGIEYSTASGTYQIDEVVGLSGVLTGSMGNLSVLTMGDGSDSNIGFSFSVPAQPTGTAPVKVRMLYAARADGPANLKFDLNYDLFDQGQDPTSGGYGTALTETVSVGASDQDIIKMVTFDIPITEFTSSGSAPYIVSAKINRDVGVASNLADDVSIIQLYADNIPGAHTGNAAGYLGGNLTVDGDLTVEGQLVLEGGSVPASGTAAGTSGTVVLDDDFMYVAVGTNNWKRSPLAAF
jgi:hypothetical protein